MSSKNPIDEITTNIALDGGYDPCTKFTGNEDFWIKNAGCDPGFTPDNGNEYCFKVLSTLETMSDGKRKCQYEFGSDMILFLSNSEVLQFFNLVKKGIRTLQSVTKSVFQ